MLEKVFGNKEEQLWEMCVREDFTHQDTLRGFLQPLISQICFYWIKGAVEADHEVEKKKIIQETGIMAPAM